MAPSQPQPTQSPPEQSPPASPTYQPNRGIPETVPQSPSETEFTTPGNAPEVTPDQNGDNWSPPSDR